MKIYPCYAHDSDPPILVIKSLRNANLSGFDLAGANFRGKDMRGCNLRGADLRDCNFSYADLRGADFTRAKLDGSCHFEGANVKGATGLAPVVPDLDAKILSRIRLGRGHLRMGKWHTCKTTHCLAGWAIVLAGRHGRALENKMGPETAGMLIFGVSTGSYPAFYNGDQGAMEELERRANDRRPLE